MSETKKEFLNMTTAFYVSGNYPSKESVKEFVEWLAEEGYQEIKHDYANMYGTYYIDIASRTYAKAHSDALIAPVVGRQGLKYDDFREIHNIFKRREEDEKTWRYRPAKLTPLPIYLEYVEGGRKEREEDRRIYFDKNPSFEEWCDDVFFYIKHDRWYMRNMPDYSRKEFDEALKDKYIRRDMENHFKNREMPLQTAGVWDLITF